MLATRASTSAPVLRLPDDLEAAVGLERPADAVEHEAVVVCDDYAHAAECRRAVSRHSRLRATVPIGPRTGGARRAVRTSASDAALR